LRPRWPELRHRAAWPSNRSRTGSMRSSVAVETSACGSPRKAWSW